MATTLEASACCAKELSQPLQNMVDYLCLYILHSLILYGLKVNLSFITNDMAQFFTVLFISLIVTWGCLIFYKLTKVGYLPMILWGEKTYNYKDN